MSGSVNRKDGASVRLRGTQDESGCRSVLVRSSCCIRILQTGGLINNGNFSLPVLEAGFLRSILWGGAHREDGLAQEQGVCDTVGQGQEKGKETELVRARGLG